MNIYQPIIGLEVHIELATKSKMFCGCPADHFGKPPNTQTCPVCLGLPGALPVSNKKAVEWTIMLGLALDCTINEESKFDRKNYFYADLPKGYQISQYDQPLCANGNVVIPSRARDLATKGSAPLDSSPAGRRAQNDKKKIVRIRRVHLEEDTGKLQHATIDGERVSLVDFNRSGVPLVEVVTEPDFRSIEEVDLFLKKLQQIVRYLGISGADMEKGSMRLEPSISVRSQTDVIGISRSDPIPSYRVELKNINSFRFARKALECEINRQSEILDSGQKLIQQTRGWNEGKNATVPQREKEEANDYRYFPEPDIPPMRFSQAQIAKLKAQIPELPDAKIKRFKKDYGLSDYDAGLITETRERADYFETAVKIGNVKSKILANWIINRGINIIEVMPAELAERIVKAQEKVEMPAEELVKIISKVIKDNDKAAHDYKSGKMAALGFLVGQVQKELKGKGDSKLVLEKLKKALSS